MAMIRGKGIGIEVVLAGQPVAGALALLATTLSTQPGFYKGSAATVAFGSDLPTGDQLEQLRRLLDEGGVAVSAVCGPAELEPLASEAGFVFSVAEVAHELSRRRALRPRGEVKLSDSARSLVADFAGARSDIAQRRQRGDTSVPRVDPKRARAEAPVAPVLHVVETAPGTLYHAGTLRGGQALHHVGNIVVVGDVNPGAELVATGDIVVFGRLAGVAHAGAQGDANATVYALRLDATQLRIATCIAADENARASAQAEAAVVRDGRIVIVPFDKLDKVGAPA